MRLPSIYRNEYVVVSYDIGHFKLFCCTNEQFITTLAPLVSDLFQTATLSALLRLGNINPVFIKKKKVFTYQNVVSRTRQIVGVYANTGIVGHFLDIICDDFKVRNGEQRRENACVQVAEHECS